MVATWKFDGKEVRIKTEKNEWFCGRDVILGFKNINCTLLEQVKKAYKYNLKSLEVWDNSSPACGPNNEGRAVDNPGRYMSTSKNQAVKP